MKKFISLILGVCICCTLSGQKVLKPVRTFIKAKNSTEALKLIEKLEKDSVAARLPRLYDLGKQAKMLVNDAENEKIYLKQAYDTAKFFNSTLDIYTYILKCEREEQRILAEEGKKMKYHKDNGLLLHRYYANLNAGARYFYKKGDYARAMQFLAMCMDIPLHPIWGPDRSVTATKPYIANAHLHLMSAFYNKSYDAVERYKPIVVNDTARVRRISMEALAISAELRGDSAAYLTYLEQGIQEYPANLLFFTHLADYYARHQNYAAVLKLSDEQLKYDSANVYILEAKSLALINLQRYTEAIEVSKLVLQADSTLADVYYNIGASYYNMALEVTLPVNINSKAYKDATTRRNAYYKEACPYLERYRQLAPDDKKRWAMMLYRIYFSLNMGKKFEEINKIVSAL